MMETAMLSVENLTKTYQTVGGFWGHSRHPVTAVHEVSFSIRPGEALGLIGESGSGKSTLARLMIGLERPTRGRVFISGTDIGTLTRRTVRALRREVQIVFQNPYTALDPLMTIGASIEEPIIHFTVSSKAERQRQVSGLLHDVGLAERFSHAYPYQLSGGERQRACIARAIALRPKFLICDEVVSSLDKSVQVQVLDLLKNLKQQYGLTYLFISHDLAVVNYLCDRVAVMRRGEIVELGGRQEVLFHPSHPYTQALMAATSYFLKDISGETRRT
ncbi:MAG: ATP-binding cassette domain-containing protein [Nitrospiraceae bacterium]